MPTADDELYAFKYVNGHPQNTRTGKLTVTAFGVLARVATGYPLLISEMTVLTALRTAATSALMATFLARRDSKVMALIGAGAQSEFQALAFKALLGIEELRVYDVDPAAVNKFIANVGTGHGLRITAARSVGEAVRGADIVTTATADKTRATILTPEMIEPGMHLNAIGGDCPGKTELHRDIVAGASVFVEYPPQTRIEGEIQQMAPDFPVTELWQVLTGTAPGRTTAEEITLFDSVGFAIEDFSTLRYVRDLTARRQSEIDLVPEMADPKDLFGLVATREVRVPEVAA
jgi:ornithine cyclodeaminase